MEEKQREILQQKITLPDDSGVRKTKKFRLYPFLRKTDGHSPLSPATEKATLPGELNVQKFQELYTCEASPENLTQAAKNILKVLDTAWWLSLSEGNDSSEQSKQKQYEKMVNGLFVETSISKANEETKEALLQDVQIMAERIQAGKEIEENAFSTALYERVAVLEAMGFTGIEDVFIKYFGEMNSRDLLRLEKIDKIPISSKLSDVLQEMHPVWNHYLEVRLSNNTFGIEIAGLATVFILSFIRSQLWNPQNNRVHWGGLSLPNNPALSFAITHVGDFLEAFLYSMAARNTLGLLYPRADEKILTGASTGGALAAVGIYEMGLIDQQQPDIADVAFGGVIGAGLYALTKFASSRIMKGKYGIYDVMKDYDGWIASLDATSEK